eukprot:COSAG02_NODE_3454_length_6713_cov_1.602359_2_plen_105_part_00
MLHQLMIVSESLFLYQGGRTTSGLDCLRCMRRESRYLKAGDALIFNDHCLHGSTARINSGQRRMVCFRYLPQHNSTNRFGIPCKRSHHLTLCKTSSGANANVPK